MKYIPLLQRYPKSGCKYENEAKAPIQSNWVLIGYLRSQMHLKNLEPS